MSVRAKQGKQLLQGVTSALLGAGVGAAGVWSMMYAFGAIGGKSHGMTKGAAGGLVFASLILVCFLVLALHEFGHLLAGLRVGFKLYCYVVGPLRIERGGEGRLTVSLNRDLSAFGGMCGMVPEDERDLLNRFATVILGGPVVSFVSGMLALGFLSLLPHEAGLLRFCLLLFGGMSLMIALITLIPMPNGVYLTDGARWMRLRRGGALAVRDAALLRLYALMISGQPTEQWPQQAITEAMVVEDGSIFEAASRWFGYLRAVDEGETELAGVHLDRAIQIVQAMPSAIAASYRVEAAYYVAWHRGEVADAQEHVDAVGKNPPGVAPESLLRARAAIALRSGQEREGRDLLHASERALQPGAASEWSRRRLREMGLPVPISATSEAAITT